MEPIHTNRLHVNIQTNFKDASKKYLWCILFLGFVPYGDQTLYVLKSLLKYCEITVYSYKKGVIQCSISKLSMTADGIGIIGVWINSLMVRCSLLSIM